jgi:hypothetical protein
LQNGLEMLYICDETIYIHDEPVRSVLLLCLLLDVDFLQGGHQIFVQSAG